MFFTNELKGRFPKAKNMFCNNFLSVRELGAFVAS